LEGKYVGIYDKYNLGHDEIKKIAAVYIDIGETLQKLINKCKGTKYGNKNL